MFIRSVKCGFCEIEERETNPGDGWPGWIQILGLADPDNPLMTEPHFCPECKNKYILPILNNTKKRIENVD